jgi:hypothetical protein
MRNRKLRDALQLLQRAFLINRKVKRDAYDHSDPFYTVVDYDLRDAMYEWKAAHINKAIKMIREHNLPIKYGKLGGVAYFEYLGEQVSFHDPYGQVTPCKQFKGAWIGRPQPTSPFSRFLAH